MTSILVTGATGFIGRRLCAALRGDGLEVIEVITPWHDVDCSDDPGGRRLVRCDMRDLDDLARMVARCSPDVIVNLAVTRTSDPGELALVGDSAVGTLISVAVELGVHLVHAGSATEFVVADASVHEHGRAKRRGSQRLSNAVTTGAVQGVTIRPFLVYGPGEHQHRFVPMAIRAAVTGGRLPLTAGVFGRDYVYVDDAVDAFKNAALTRMTDEIPVDLCTGTSTTNSDLIRAVEHATGKPVRTDVGAFPARDWDRPTWTADPSRGRELLGREFTPLAEGLRRSVRYWEQRP